MEDAQNRGKPHHQQKNPPPPCTHIAASKQGIARFGDNSSPKDCTPSSSSPQLGYPIEAKKRQPGNPLAPPHLLKITTMYIEKENRTKFCQEKFVCQCARIDQFKMAETIGKKNG